MPHAHVHCGRVRVWRSSRSGRSVPVRGPSELSVSRKRDPRKLAKLLSESCVSRRRPSDPNDSDHVAQPVGESSRGRGWSENRITAVRSTESAFPPQTTNEYLSCHNTQTVATVPYSFPYPSSYSGTAYLIPYLITLPRLLATTILYQRYAHIAMLKM